MSTTYELIAKNVLGSDTASVTFSSIPGTYTDLCLLSSARITAAGSTALRGRFNSDTSSSYTRRLILGDGSIVQSSSATATYLFIGYTTISTDTADTFGSGEAYIPNYTAAVNKSVSFTGVSENNGLAYMAVMAELWSSTDAITSINIFPSTGDIAAGSSFYLYGITKA